MAVSCGDLDALWVAAVRGSGVVSALIAEESLFAAGLVDAIVE